MKNLFRNSLNNNDGINDLNSPDESITHRQKSEHSINLSTRIDIDSDEFDDRKEFKVNIVKITVLQRFL